MFIERERGRERERERETKREREKERGRERERERPRFSIISVTSKLIFLLLPRGYLLGLSYSDY